MICIRNRDHGSVFERQVKERRPIHRAEQDHCARIGGGGQLFDHRSEVRRQASRFFHCEWRVPRMLLSAPGLDH